jgi:hypothetical protein
LAAAAPGFLKMGLPRAALRAVGSASSVDGECATLTRTLLSLSANGQCKFCARSFVVTLYYLATMPPNPKLIEPLTRIENAARRAMGAMFTADKTPPKDLDLVRREVQEIKDALQAFESAVASGEMIGQEDNVIRSHGST